MNNTLEGINSRVTEAEECISDLEDKRWKSMHVSGFFWEGQLSIYTDALNSEKRVEERLCESQKED